jgi:hypothetical protein
MRSLPEDRRQIVYDRLRQLRQECDALLADLEAGKVDRATAERRVADIKAAVERVDQGKDAEIEPCG